MDRREMSPQIDPNEADVDTLRTIPGVGHALAARIIEARPFSSPEDMTRVPGITTKFIEKNSPNLVFKTAETPVPEVMGQPDEIAPGVDATDETTEQADSPQDSAPVSEGKEIILISKREEEMPDELPPPGEAEKNGNEKISPRYVTRTQAMWMAFNSGLFAFVLAVALSLGLIASLNGGLRFASFAQAEDLTVDVGGLKTQAESLAGDVTSLRTRMDNLEVLSGRVASLEETFAALQGDLETVTENMNGFNDQVESLSGEIAGLEEDNSKYQSFLDGLFELLKTITTPEEAR